MWIIEIVQLTKIQNSVKKLNFDQSFIPDNKWSQGSGLSSEIK